MKNNKPINQYEDKELSVAEFEFDNEGIINKSIALQKARYNHKTKKYERQIIYLNIKQLARMTKLIEQSKGVA